MTFHGFILFFVHSRAVNGWVSISLCCLHSQLNGALDQETSVLEDRGILLALDNPAYRFVFRVLTRHYWNRFSSLLNGGDDCARQCVVGREYTVGDFIPLIGGRQQRRHAILRVIGLPPLSCDLGEIVLARFHNQGTVIDLGLKHFHRTVEEFQGIRIVGRAAK